MSSNEVVTNGNRIFLLKSFENPNLLSKSPAPSSPSSGIAVASFFPCLLANTALICFAGDGGGKGRSRRRLLQKPSWTWIVKREKRSMKSKGFWTEWERKMIWNLGITKMYVFGGIMSLGWVWRGVGALLLRWSISNPLLWS